MQTLLEMAKPYGLPVARALLSAVFLYSGFDKLLHWRAGIKEVADLGLPWPSLFGTGTIAVQLVGSLAVISGMGAAYGAAMLAAFTVAATFLGHRVWLLHGDEAKRELTTSFEHLAIVGGLILVVFQSPHGS